MKMQNLKGLLRFADSMRHCERPLERVAIDRVGILFGICCSLVATLARCSLAMTCPCGAFVYAVVLLVQGLRQRRRVKLISAAGLFAILLAGSAVLMEFITRPL